MGCDAGPRHRLRASTTKQNEKQRSATVAASFLPLVRSKPRRSDQWLDCPTHRRRGCSCVIAAAHSVLALASRFQSIAISAIRASELCTTPSARVRNLPGRRFPTPSAPFCLISRVVAPRSTERRPPFSLSFYERFPSGRAPARRRTRRPPVSACTSPRGFHWCAPCACAVVSGRPRLRPRRRPRCGERTAGSTAGRSGPAQRRRCRARRGTRARS